MGVGEILINSVDKDGTMSGMNYNIIEKTKEITNLPIIYCGGIGSIQDIKNAFTHNISGVAAGSFFVFYGPHKAVLISYPHKDLEKIMISDQNCTVCVMNTSTSNIFFDSNGQCNYCNNFIKNEFKEKTKFRRFNKKNKEIFKNSKYDCIVGLSGGIDSSYTLVKVVEMGLKPLAVHMDNGWNSELAQNNIENLVKSLNVDLYTNVIDWSEYKSMMNSFFDSDVIDIEMLMDII